MEEVPQPNSSCNFSIDRETNQVLSERLTSSIARVGNFYFGFIQKLISKTIAIIAFIWLKLSNKSK